MVQRANADQGLPNIPSQIVDEVGRVTPVWYRFFLKLFLAAGGAGGVSIGLNMPSIFSVGNSPLETTNGTITVDLNTEAANSVFAGPAAGGGGDPTFRALVYADLLALPYNVSFAESGKPLAGMILNIPITDALTFPSNFTKSVLFASTASTLDEFITVNKIVSGSPIGIGMITIASASHVGVFTTASGAPQNMAAGDTLQLVFPPVQDASLADIGITFRGVRN